MGVDSGKIQFLPQSVQSRVAAKQPHLGIHQQRRDTVRDGFDGPVQRLERPVLVAERCIDQRQSVRFSVDSRKMLNFSPASDPDVACATAIPAVLSSMLSTWFPQRQSL